MGCSLASLIRKAICLYRCAMKRLEIPKRQESVDVKVCLLCSLLTEQRWGIRPSLLSVLQDATGLSTGKTTVSISNPFRHSKDWRMQINSASICSRVSRLSVRRNWQRPLLLMQGIWEDSPSPPPVSDMLISSHPPTDIVQLVIKWMESSKNKKIKN